MERQEESWSTFRLTRRQKHCWRKGWSDWLRYVPPAILAALVAPAALAPQGRLEVGTHTWAVLAGVIFAWRTRSVLWTILGGIAAFWLLKMLGV